MNVEIGKVFQEYLDALVKMLPQLITALVVLVAFGAIGWGIKRFMTRKKRSDEDNLVPRFSANLIRWAFWVVGAIAAMHIMGFGGVMSSIIAGAGISAIIFGFAFKDIAENFLAGILLAANRPFGTGDVVEVAGSKGVVRKLDLRTLHLRVADGRDIYIPNSLIIKNVLTNYTRDGLLRVDFPVGLDTEADLRKASQIILDVLFTSDRVLKQPPPNVLVEALGVSTVDIRVLFWIDQFAVRQNTPDGPIISTKSYLIEKVRDALLENGFTLPSTILEHKIYDQKDPIPVKVLRADAG